MKRIATILLALMIVGVSIIPTMTSAATCDHSWVNVYTYIYQDTGSDTVHKVLKYVAQVCTKCCASTTPTLLSSGYESHQYNITDGGHISGTARHQHIYRCPLCGDYKLVIIDCSGPPCMAP